MHPHETTYDAALDLRFLHLQTLLDGPGALGENLSAFWAYKHQFHRK
jgi:hypothetical protein